MIATSISKTYQVENDLNLTIGERKRYRNLKQKLGELGHSINRVGSDEYGMTYLVVGTSGTYDPTSLSNAEALNQLLRKRYDI